MQRARIVVLLSGGLIGCSDDLLLRVDGLDQGDHPGAVELTLKADKRTCTFRFPSLQRGNDSHWFRLPLNCLPQGQKLPDKFELSATTLDKNSCKLSSGKKLVNLWSLGLGPDEASVQLVSNPQALCTVAVNLFGEGSLSSATDGAGAIACKPCESAANPPAASSGLSAGCTQTCVGDFPIGTAIDLMPSPRYQASWQVDNGLSKDSGTGLLRVVLDHRHELNLRFSPGPCAGDDLCLYNPVSEGKDLHASAAVSGQGVWAVGDGGIVLFAEGNQLSAVNSGISADLYGVAASSNGRTVLVVGAGGAIGLLRDGLWSQLARDTSVILRAAAVSPDGTEAWVVGDSGTVVHLQGLLTGASFSRTTIKDGVPSVSLRAVWRSPTTGDVWIAGDSRTILSNKSAKQSFVQYGTPPVQTSYTALWGQGEEVFATGLGGNIISLVGANFTTQTSNISEDLRAIWGRSSKDLWVAGSGGTLVHFDGTTWTTRASNTSYDLNAGSFTSDNSSLVIGNAGTIFQYDGAVAKPLGVPWNFNDVWGTSDQDVWAVGERVMVHQTPAGLQVVQQSQYFNRIWGSGADNIWAVGADGVLSHYDGQRWTTWTQKFNHWLYDVCGNSASDIWAVGEAGTILQFDGSSWALARKPDSLQTDLYGVWCGGRDNVWFVGDQGAAVHYVGDSYAPEVVPGNMALRSTWSDGQAVYAVGRQGALAKRTPDGQWQPKYLTDRKDLLRIYGDAAAAGNSAARRVWIAGEQGTLLSLDPGSMTTTPLRYRQQKTFSGTYSGIWAAANRGVWFAGQGGILLHQLSSTP